jgi:hypothetical protein
MERSGTSPSAENKEEMLLFEIPDETLETAANTMTGPAMSLPGAPTVSVLVVCCSVDENV